MSADRSMPVLSIIMKEAEASSLRPEGSNPCRGIKRYRRQNRQRFLSGAELARLGGALRSVTPSSSVTILWLLVLTGCRSGEIRTLRWTDYRDGNLFLRDSKTGPRTVWLSDPARKLLDIHPRTSLWVFPALTTTGPFTKTKLCTVWNQIRADAGLRDVRVHDLRHTYASMAISSGETVLTVGRLLGHNKPETTLKYAHHAEIDVEQAATEMDAVLGATRP
ncbi:MAG: site-specific integrase [Aestuariivita sp.]|nr:site-specific integrase [Aestuariivita sp.]